MVSYIELAVNSWLDASSRHTIVWSLVFCNQVKLWSCDDSCRISSPLIAISLVVCAICFLLDTLTISCLIVVEVRSCNVEILESVLLSCTSIALCELEEEGCVVARCSQSLNLVVTIVGEFLSLDNSDGVVIVQGNLTSTCVISYDIVGIDIALVIDIDLAVTLQIESSITLVVGNVDVICCDA